MSTVTLDMPATTFVALREQAKALKITGRGSMRKGDLIEAIRAEITRRTAQSLVDGTADGVLAVEPHGDGSRTLTLPAKTGPALRSVTTSHGRVLTTRSVEKLESCGLAPGESVVDIRPLDATGGTRKGGRKGTGLLMTREGRKTYPARKATRGRKGGRK